MVSTTVSPRQAAALTQLLADTHALTCEITPAEHMSLRVATYHAREDRGPLDPPAEARWFTISCAGTVREIAPTPVAEAA